MGTSAKLLTAESLALPEDTYIYTLARLADSCVAISSDDSLTYFDPSTLAVKHTVKNASAGLTCLIAASDRTVVATAGRDGAVRCWDQRAKAAGLECRNRESNHDGLLHDCIWS